MIRIIEMNPRVSRSSALASKATGFPIAKVAAKLAVGYLLGRDRQRHHPAARRRPRSSRPSIGHVVTKNPRFAASRKISRRAVDPVLTTAMKSVGEAMAIGRTFAMRSRCKRPLRSMETGLTGLDEVEIEGLGKGDDHNALRAAIGKPTTRTVCSTSPRRCARTHEPRRRSTTFAASMRWFPGAHRGDRSCVGEKEVQRLGLPEDAVNMRSPQG